MFQVGKKYVNKQCTGIHECVFTFGAWGYITSPKFPHRLPTVHQWDSRYWEEYKEPKKVATEMYVYYDEDGEKLFARDKSDYFGSTLGSIGKILVTYTFVEDGGNGKAVEGQGLSVEVLKDGAS